MSSSSKAKSGNSSSSNGGGGGGPCGACKFLRRKCVKGCVFAPFFDSEQGAAQFAAVHKVFGASNASKMLLRIPPQKRLDAALTLCYEALARLRDPVYGCAAHILDLQHQVVNLQAELALVQAQLFAWQMQRASSSSSSSSSSSWGPTTDYLHQSSLSLMLSACACACDGSSTLFNPSTSSMELELAAAAAAAAGGFCNPINPELSDQNGNGEGDGDGVISVSSILAASRCLH